MHSALLLEESRGSRQIKDDVGDFMLPIRPLDLGSASTTINSRFSRDVTAAMLVYRTIAKKVFWEFDSIIMQNLATFYHCFVHQHGLLVTRVKAKNRLPRSSKLCLQASKESDIILFDVKMRETKKTSHSGFSNIEASHLISVDLQITILPINSFPVLQISIKQLWCKEITK